ncbi:MAG: hypothetical protein P1U70_13890 [Saprospiraceae bacterium]|nr:hypothetical protein [Saprospiraceae bacterium]
MAQKFLFLTLLKALFILSCSKEPVTKNETLHPETGEIQSLVDAAVDELNNDYKNRYATTDNLNGEVSTRGTVVVPAGSVNAIEDAIKEASSNGTVILEAGNHETPPLVLDEPIRLKDNQEQYY